MNIYSEYGACQATIEDRILFIADLFSSAKAGDLRELLGSIFELTAVSDFAGFSREFNELLLDLVSVCCRNKHEARYGSANSQEIAKLWEPVNFDFKSTDL